jgi:hypothetical protein
VGARRLSPHPRKSSRRCPGPSAEDRGYSCDYHFLVHPHHQRFGPMPKVQLSSAAPGGNLVLLKAVTTRPQSQMYTLSDWGHLPRLGYANACDLDFWFPCQHDCWRCDWRLVGRYRLDLGHSSWRLRICALAALVLALDSGPSPAGARSGRRDGGGATEKGEMPLGKRQGYEPNRKGDTLRISSRGAKWRDGGSILTSWNLCSAFSPMAKRWRS